jgi:hypothetical protein
MKMLKNHIMAYRSHLILADRSECIGRVSGATNPRSAYRMAQAKTVPAYGNIQTGSKKSCEKIASCTMGLTVGFLKIKEPRILN